MYPDLHVMDTVGSRLLSLGVVLLFQGHAVEPRPSKPLGMNYALFPTRYRTASKIHPKLPPTSLGLPPYLEGLERVLSPAHLERPALWFALPVSPVLATLLLEWHKPNLLCLQRLRPVLGKQVIRHVLEMGLLSCGPAQLPVVPQVGELCGILFEVSAQTSQNEYYLRTSLKWGIKKALTV